MGPAPITDQYKYMFNDPNLLLLLYQRFDVKADKSTPSGPQQDFFYVQTLFFIQKVKKQ
jgi:hypothetical protein